ncbi:hypothetical protein P2318_10585 [Myxococcaceae bacterium GXIMD 01537]
MKNRLLGAAVLCAVTWAGCGGDAQGENNSSNSGASPTETRQVSMALGASCVLGDGYVIASGSYKSVYPISCPSDCYDYPEGGFEFCLYCLNGVIGENDPLLTGGTVGPPFVDGTLFNGYSRCSVRPTAQWAQSADRKTCVRR